MQNPEGEANLPPLRLHFDRRLKLEFHGSRITSDAGLLAYRELGDVLGLTSLAGSMLADSRTGKNGWHGLVGLLRQSVYGRLAGYEDVNDADRLGHDPAMRWIVGDFEEMCQFMDTFKLAAIGTSLRDLFTLINPMTRADNSIRVSVGCEATEDIIGDFSQALKQI